MSLIDEIEELTGNFQANWDDFIKRRSIALQEVLPADGPPDGSPFAVGEEVVIKNCTFKVVYVGETAILFEPLGPVIVDKERT